MLADLIALQYNGIKRGENMDQQKKLSAEDIELKEKMKVLYMDFLKETSNQQAAANMTNAFLTNKLLVELIRFSSKNTGGNNGNRVQNQTVPTPTKGNRR